MGSKLKENLLLPAELITAFLEERGYSWRQLERGEIYLGGKPLEVRDIQVYLINTDPVLWAERFLVNRPEDGGGLWRLFQYQKDSMRYRGDVVHEDGAEVGKTREIVALLLWGGVTRAGGSLVAGADDGNLEELWDEIEWQRENNPWLNDQIDGAKSKLKPYKKLVFRNGNIQRFRPAGHDGRAFRAVHVSQFGFFDEAALPKNEQTFSEFFRALKPNAEARLYSVPDGVRSSPFFRFCQQATPYSEIDGSAAKNTGRDKQRRFVKFNWPKTLMPPPYWNEARELEMIERYGGRDSSGFVRNVLGGWGDPRDAVFPWTQFSPCVRLVEDYVVAKLIRDSATSSIYVEAYRPNPSYEVRGGDSSGEDDDGPGPMRVVFKESYSIGNFELAATLHKVFMPPEGAQHHVGGFDVGRSSDQPTEIGISQIRGLTKRWCARLQLKHFSYDEQAEAVRAIDRIFEPDHGWGVDAGGVGKAVEDGVRSSSSGYNFEDRLTGFVFNAKTEARDEDGEILLDTKGNPRRVSYKELATQLLERDMQRGQLAIPWDPTYLRDFPSHTSNELKSGERTFFGRDHVIDEKRVEMLRLFELEHGCLTTAPITFLPVPGVRRSSSQLMRDF